MSMSAVNLWHSLSSAGCWNMIWQSWAFTIERPSAPDLSTLSCVLLNWNETFSLADSLLSFELEATCVLKRFCHSLSLFAKTRHRTTVWLKINNKRPATALQQSCLDNGLLSYVLVSTYRTKTHIHVAPLTAVNLNQWAY